MNEDEELLARFKQLRTAENAAWKKLFDSEQTGDTDPSIRDEWMGIMALMQELRPKIAEVLRARQDLLRNKPVRDIARLTRE